MNIRTEADISLPFSSPSGVTGTLRSDPDSSNGDVDYWGAVDIWDDYQLYNVLSGGAGLLVWHIGLDVGCWLEWVRGYIQEAQCMESYGHVHRDHIILLQDMGALYISHSMLWTMYIRESTRWPLIWSIVTEYYARPPLTNIPYGTVMLHRKTLDLILSQKNLYHKKNSTITPSPAKGPYCFRSSSQLILTAALLYFLLSSLNL